MKKGFIYQKDVFKAEKEALIIGNKQEWEDEQAVVTCLSLDCPERKSVCCDTISKYDHTHGGWFRCTKCGELFIGGKCTATKKSCCDASIFPDDVHTIDCKSTKPLTMEEGAELAGFDSFDILGDSPKDYQ